MIIINIPYANLNIRTHSLHFSLSVHRTITHFVETYLIRAYISDMNIAIPLLHHALALFPHDKVPLQRPPTDRPPTRNKHEHVCECVCCGAVAFKCTSSWAAAAAAAASFIALTECFWSDHLPAVDILHRFGVFV